MPTSKRRFSKEADLLPLNTAKVKMLSLGNHLAMEALYSEHGTEDQILHLLGTIYLSYCLRGVVEGDGDADLYRKAEEALEAYSERVRGNPSTLPTEDERLAIMRMLTIHDTQLAAVTVRRYLEAWQILGASCDSTSNSPIPKNNR
jgi:hypothetical protein